MRVKFFTIFLLSFVIANGQQIHPKPIKGTERAKTFCSFKINNKTLAKNQLPDTNYIVAIEALTNKKVKCIPSSKKNKRIAIIRQNGFIQTLNTAFNDHRPITFSPDAIWLLICQGVSIHCNVKFDSIQPLILNNKSKTVLTVRDDSLITNNCRNWEQTISQLSNETKKYFKKDYHSAMCPTFTTTTKTIQTTYQTTLLESVQSGFGYVAVSGCGIPRITLTGTLQDWIWIKKHLHDFDYLGLNFWSSQLDEIINEFINAYNGSVNVEFWNSIFKEEQVYADEYVSGWVIKFFPYIKSFDWKIDSVNYDYNTFITYTRNQYLDGKLHLTSTLKTTNFPEGYAKIDLAYINYFNKIPLTENLEVYAGFLGIHQDNNSINIAPEIGWAICYKDSGCYRDVNTYYRDNSNEHENTFWYPGINDKLNSSPIYASHINKTYADGISFLTNYITTNLKENKLIQTNDSIQIKLLIAWTGELINTEIKCNDIKLKKHLQNTLMHLPYVWKPATGSKFLPYEIAPSKKVKSVYSTCYIKFGLFY